MREMNSRQRWQQAVAGALLALSGGVAAAAGVDPLQVEIDMRDAQRFAALLAAHPEPTAAQLQQGYLDGAGRGVAIFTPGRIVDAEHLAQVVAKHPEDYRHAIQTCLPELASLNADLRAIYLAYAGLLPELPLPAIYVVFGGRNSGGTAAPDGQAIGLEMMCRAGTTRAAFRQSMRAIFAHETVHTWQQESTPGAQRDPLLAWALREGVADYLASVVTGEVPDPARNEWATARQDWLWHEFQQDRAAMAALPEAAAQGKEGRAFSRRWFANFGTPPEGWPGEAGYWIGMRIAEGYVARAANRQQAIRELIALRDPQAILNASGFGL